MTLFRRDGAMLLRQPHPERAMGVKLPAESQWYSIVARGGGSYDGAATTTGVDSLIVVHPLSDYRLVVDIVMSHADVYAQWRQETAFIVGFAITASLTSMTLFWLLACQFRRQIDHNAQLEEATIRLREGQEILRGFTAMATDWLWEQDAAFCYTRPPEFPDVWQPDDVRKTRWDLADPAMSPDRWAAHLADLSGHRPFRDFRWERIKPDGERRFLTSSGDPVFDRYGVFIGYRGTGRDITEEVQSQARLAQANVELAGERERFAIVLDNIMQGICFFDGDQRLLLCNRRYMEIYDLPSEATEVGTPLQEIMTLQIAAGTAPEMPEDAYLCWQRISDSERGPTNVTLPLKNGRFVAVVYQSTPGGGFVATHEDITERQKAEANMAFMAHYDSLTKLANRVLFRERVEQAITFAGRGREFAIICLDLDDFKKVNDTLGHPVGDHLLVAVADRLRACTREVDTIGRLGGDEFAIIHQDLRHADDARHLVDRITAAFREPLDIDGHRVMTGMSIGVAVPADGNVTYETLMRDADTALYLAKTEGRGTARFFKPDMDTRIRMRRSLETDLQGAVARNEFELYYQPQVNLISNRINGFEALLRWNHPDRGQVSPLDFIPVAEETGQIVDIGEWVLRTACFEAATWPVEIRVAVNLSPVQFKQGDIVANVQAALTASGLTPERLELEITESVFLRDTADTLAALHKLRAMGISVALDDFGTGYSSLSYLRRFPFNKLKIDQSFVRGMLTNRESLSIIRAVTGLGDSLSMQTIAEGVETQEQLNLLRDEGCTEVQGYLFSRPRPASEVPSLIERLRSIAKPRVAVKN